MKDMPQPATGEAEDTHLIARPLPELLASVLKSCPHAERALSEVTLYVPPYLRWELVRRQRANEVEENAALLSTGFEGYYAGFEMTPAEIIEDQAAHAVASLRAAKKLGEDVDAYFRLLEGKGVNLEELDHLSAILGATISRLRALKYIRSQDEQEFNEAFHSETATLARNHIYLVDHGLERTDFQPHHNPTLDAIAPLLHNMGLKDEEVRGYYFLLLLGKVGNPVLRAALRES